jgi:hypothetical protein
MRRLVLYPAEARLSSEQGRGSCDAATAESVSSNEGGEMRRALIPAFLLVLVSVFLGATVFREPIAWAAQAIDSTIIGPLDGQGNVRVHEQGTAQVVDTESPARKAVLFRFAGQTDIVPAGQRLIVTYLNVRAEVFSGAPPATSCRLQTIVGGTTSTIGSIRLLDAGGTSVIGSEQVFIPVNAGERFDVNCGGLSNINANVAGYFTSVG